MQNLYKKIKPELERLSQGAKEIAVAVSGGSDSMAMALLLGEYAKKSGTEIIAITVDHRLRAESAREATQVGLWLATYGIKHHILCWEGDKKSSNIQAEARNARYRLMADFCAQNKIKLLTVAHTSEDQAETVLIRMMRGSGVDGLAGISDTSEVFGIKVIRPLLNFTRAELRGYLQSKKQDWIEDPSNQNSKFKRVQVRKFISASDEPELLTMRLADTASHMARAKDYVEAKTRESLAGIFTFHMEGYYTINTTKFKKLHVEERLRSLATALQHAGGQEYRPRFENLSKLHDNILSGDIGAGCTLWGCEISSGKKQNDKNILYIYREPALVAAGIEVTANSQIMWDGRFECIIGSVKIENLQVGALGTEGYKYISKNNERLLSAVKIPKKVIYTLPCLMALEKVLAVPQIGYYNNEKLRKLFRTKVKTPPNIFVI